MAEKVDKKVEALARVDEQAPMSLIQLAIERQADISTLERLLDLKERVDKEKARQAFINALAAFQAELPPIKKEQDCPQ